MSQVSHYVQRYCEENVWHLGQEIGLVNQVRKAVFISNNLRRCVFFRQRASSSPELSIVWDYHVVLICHDRGWQVWDLDATLSVPTALQHYLDLTFRTEVDSELMPYFRIIDFEEFRNNFSSDRSHMRNPSGGWIAPPPAWPMILLGKSSNLFDFVDMRKKFLGKVMNFDDFRKEYGK